MSIEHVNMRATLRVSAPLCERGHAVDMALSGPSRKQATEIKTLYGFIF